MPTQKPKSKKKTSSPSPQDHPNVPDYGGSASDAQQASSGKEPSQKPSMNQDRPQTDVEPSRSKPRAEDLYRPPDMDLDQKDFQQTVDDNLSQYETDDPRSR